MNTYAISVGIIKSKNKILILKRSPTKRFEPNKWEPVSGFIKEHETAEQTIIREVKEETGLNAKIEKSGRAFESIDKETRWIIMPFLISVDSDKVKIDKEHTEYKWLEPEEIKEFDCVIDIDKDLQALGINIK